jgi:effector-binding domain-containing protein
MSYEIEVITLEPTSAVVLPRTVRRSALSDAIGPAVDRATSLVAAARAQPSGPPFVRYLAFGEDVEMEIGFPVESPQNIPALRSTMLPGGTAASTWHEGPYSGLPAAFAAVETWIDEQGATAGKPWEIYWTAHDADPARTQIVWPVTLP